ncbi:CrcB protein [Sinobaca qinghaiensis]|uniref:Fluoride-specific ion channel FluC n=1 Tax=Sinobaca qinghaiensis TaxID=342944 RepID=A0A419V7V8_9BACL|nr:CrcB family protein [Sinobaca qinghaiensis]RKD76155.1 CrcB protein [Sinobaca qinghaiensis]
MNKRFGPPSVLLAIAAGAMLGTLLRYSINAAAFDSIFPFGTLMENWSGSALLGALTGFFAIFTVREWISAGLGVGLCGGYTTFSTLVSDTVLLGSALSPLYIAAYILPTIVGGIAFAWAGFAGGQRLGRKLRSSEEGRRL